MGGGGAVSDERRRGGFGEKSFCSDSACSACQVSSRQYLWLDTGEGVRGGARAVPGARGVNGARGSSQCDVCIVPTPCEARCPEISAPRAPRA